MDQPGGRSRDIAIIGLACRFPGAQDWRAYWENLARGVESITFFDDATLLRAGVDPAILADPHYVRAAPVLADFDRFDAAFFEYSPREARIIDPQQRLFLEVCWEAFEDAGYWPEKFAGQVGVFAGAGGVVSSYFASHPGLHGSTGSVEHIGNDKDFLATRVSYKLNLTGPSLTVQTACSTSLVAVNLACRSILSGESDMAIAGAATLRVPHHSGYLAPAGDIQSPDGHCRAFDAAARGTVFGSGVGAVLLKHVDDALADGDHIYAVIRGSAVNNDGAAKVSYTASSVQGQAKAMLEAFDRAGVAPAALDYIETHGTGTVVGDPLEIDALTRVFRTDTERTAFCAIGSVKTNIGHLEQSAGVASLIKVALALHQRKIPPSLHFVTPNPKIAFARTPFFVNTVLRDWPERAAPSLAGVNALGLGGTNAFAILAQAPEPAARTQTTLERPLHVLALAARTASALRELIERWHRHLEAEVDQELADQCYTAATGRAPFDVRFTASAATRAQMLAQLAQPAPQSFDTRAGKRPLAFLFTGQGAQYPGMTAELLRTQPVFRAALERCDRYAREQLDLPLLELIQDESQLRIHQTGAAQPALFAVEWALAQMWLAWGIVPDAVLGHSVGEYVAACVAGVYDFEDALTLIVARGRLMQALPAGGAMATLFADGATVQALLGERIGAELAIAAFNSPENTVISGSAAALAEAFELAAQAGVEGRALTVSHAFHSPLMQPILGELEQLAARFVARAPRIPFIGNLNGVQSKVAPAPAYWSAHSLGAVRFAEGVHALAALGILDYLEIGPGATLAALAQRTLCTPADAGKRFMSSIAKGREWGQLTQTLGALWRSGAPFDWRAFDAPYLRRRISGPTYPFSRERYWIEHGQRPAAARAEDLLGPRLASPLALWQFQSEYGRDLLPWMSDHRIFGQMVLPLTAGLVALAKAGQARCAGAAVALTGLTYKMALQVPEDATLLVQTILADRDGAIDVELCSLDQATPGAWRSHMAGTIEALAHPALSSLNETPAQAFELASLAALAPGQFYPAIAPLGFGYGPGFRALVGLWRGPGSVVGEVVLPAHLSARAHALHPALLDACLHTYVAVLPEYRDLAHLPASSKGTFLPISIERFEIYRSGVERVWVNCRLRAEAPGAAGHTVDIHIFGDDGAAVALIGGLNVGRLTVRQLQADGASGEVQTLFRPGWIEQPALAEPTAALRDGWLIVGAADLAATLTQRLGERGLTAMQCRQIDWTDAAAAYAVFDAAASQPGGLHGVVLMLALDVCTRGEMSGAQMAAAEAHCCAGTLQILKAIVTWAESSAAAPRVWIVTRNAHAPDLQAPDALALDVQPAESDPLHAAVCGIGRVCALEHPGLWGGMLDLGSDDDLDALVKQLQAGAGEPEIALRGGRRLVPRLEAQRTTPNGSDAIAPPFDAQATYLITGGLGALGMIVAHWLVERHGVRHLVLTARRAPGESAAIALAQLAAQGAQIVVKAADIADPHDVETLFADIRRELPPIKGIFHCAGLLDDSVLVQMDWDKYARVTRPKVLGGWLLHRASADLALDHFVLFSSVLSVLGAMGQVNYVAGNAFLDGLGAHRRHAGLTAQVINWGPWAESGLATESGQRGASIWDARGTEYITVEQGIAALETIMAQRFGQTVVARTDWSRWAAQYLQPPPFLEKLAAAGTLRAAAPLARHADVRARLAAASTTARKPLLVTVIAELAGAVLELAGAINPEQPLRELGLDSLIAITLINQLDALLGVRVAAATMLKGPSVAQLADELLPRIVLPGVASGEAPASPAQAVSKPVAGGLSHGTAGKWLVEIHRNPQARYRLICFPFAGGGSAIYRGWAENADPDGEILSIEPPGRLSRIHEAPLTRIEDFVDALMPELTALSDLPLALFGHCIGGLTMYEVARALIERQGKTPLHLFASGTRPPHRLIGDGPFEKQLLGALRQLPQFNPMLPSHRQPDSVLGEILRHFQIEATGEMLAIPQLRALVLPVVRAEFEMAGRYEFAPTAPWTVPITGFRGRDDLYVTHEDALAWGELTQGVFRLHTRDGAHFGVVDDRAFIQTVITQTLAELLGATA